MIDEWGLSVVVEERTGLGATEEDSDLGFQSREIIRGPDDGIYEIAWEAVACFAVRGDPFPIGPVSTATVTEADPNSPFMKWVKSETRTEPNYLSTISGGGETTAELQHWVISCNEAHIDVAGLGAPSISTR